MQLMGIPPSAVSTCSLYPIQEVVWPLALRLHRRVCQHCGRLILSCRQPSAPSPAPLPCVAAPACEPSASLPSASAEASPAFDRRRIPRDVLHQMAIHRPRNQRLMQTAQTGKGAKTSPRSEAGRHRSSRTAASLPSTSALDQAARSNTALAMKARASAARSTSGRPTWPRSRAEEPQPASVPEPRRRARSARPSGQARPRASGITLVERRTSNPIASRAGTRLHSSVVASMRCFAAAHDTHEGGPVPPQRPSLRQKNRSPQLFCKRLRGLLASAWGSLPARGHWG